MFVEPLPLCACADYSEYLTLMIKHDAVEYLNREILNCEINLFLQLTKIHYSVRNILEFYMLRCAQDT